MSANAVMTAKSFPLKEENMNRDASFCQCDADGRCDACVDCRYDKTGREKRCKSYLHYRGSLGHDRADFSEYRHECSIKTLEGWEACQEAHARYWDAKNRKHWPAPTERAFVVKTKDKLYTIAVQGERLEAWYSQHYFPLSLEALCPSIGFWIWEGVFEIAPTCYKPIGTWRRPTKEELTKVVKGITPWDGKE